MALLSAFEFLVLLAIAGLLFVLATRIGRGRRSYNLLSILIIGLLLFAVLSLVRLIFTLTIILVLTVVIFAALMFLILIRR